LTTEAQVSIVVPTHNRRHSVMRLVRSLSRQTGVSVQLLVVVEGSTDGTLEALAACRVPNLEVIHHAEPRGVSAARNAGLARAEAEYVGFIDDDDFWAPNRASDAIEAILADPCGAAWSGCGVATIDGRMKVLGLEPPPIAETIAQDLYRCNPIPGGGSAVIARTDLVRSAGGFSPDFADLADWELSLRLSRLSPLAVVRQHQIAYTFDLGSPSNTRAARSLEELIRLRATHRFGVDGNADIDLDSWNGWVFSLCWRTKDRPGMVRFCLRDAVRTRSPWHIGRAVGHGILPMSTQLRLHKLRRRRSLRDLESIDAVKAVERWLSKISDESTKVSN
jgi:glycosyltransferase involved in cell wall biosynthesis